MKWGTTSATAIEDNMDVYLGHTIFNRHNERIKERGKSSGYMHGKKFKSKEEWVTTKNTHEPLISLETAEKIKEMKRRGFRHASTYAKKVYALSGVMKCALCGTNFTGDRGIYRCNSGTKPGTRCPNNVISQNRVEEAILALLGQHVFNFRNIKDFIDRVKGKMKAGQFDMKELERKVIQLDSRIQKVIDMGLKGLIEEDEMKTALEPLRKQRVAIIETLESERSIAGSFDITDEEII